MNWITSKLWEAPSRLYRRRFSKFQLRAGVCVCNFLKTFICDPNDSKCYICLFVLFRAHLSIWYLFSNKILFCWWENGMWLQAQLADLGMYGQVPNGELKNGCFVFWLHLLFQRETMFPPARHVVHSQAACLKAAFIFSLKVPLSEKAQFSLKPLSQTS